MSQTFLSTYIWSISNVQADLSKFKGLLIKIKVIKGVSAKLKGLKVSKGFKGSTRQPEKKQLDLIR